MANWTYKQWAALIAALVAFSVALVGFGETAIIVLIGVAGYFIGKYLDGEIDLEDIRNRAQGREQGPAPGQEPAPGRRLR